MRDRFAYFEPEGSRYRDRQKSASASYRLTYHIVPTTRYRRERLTLQVAESLLESVRAICKDREYLLLGAAILPEHVHLLVGLRPEMSVSGFIRDVKGISAAGLRRPFGIIRLWGDGYFGDSVGGKNPAQIKSYLEPQHIHHAGPPSLSGRGARRRASTGRVAQAGGRVDKRRDF
jgi:putative transposase